MEETDIIIRSLQISSLDDKLKEGEEEEDLVDDDGDVIEEEEDDDEDEAVITLGFFENPKNRFSLLSHMFPSKAGGVTAWLDPVNLPSEKSRTCGFCREPLQFLLQGVLLGATRNVTHLIITKVYAPIATKESTFHRTLFVFMCTSMGCLLKDQHEQWKRRPDKQSRCVKIFRCQLPRLNPFYSSEPPRNYKIDKPSEIGVNDYDLFQLHFVVGVVPGEETRFVGAAKVHVIAPKNTRPSTYEFYLIAVASNNLWPEFEIISEDEAEFDTESSDCNPPNSIVSKGPMGGSFKSMSDDFQGDDDQRSWVSFQVRIAKAPEQVLRYSRDAMAKPLWPTSIGRPSKADIPKCNYCDGPLCYELQAQNMSRIFELYAAMFNRKQGEDSIDAHYSILKGHWEELSQYRPCTTDLTKQKRYREEFQILPQLLYYFDVKNDANSLDWATIVLYTCINSCEASVVYKEEFAWVQLSSPSSAA
ncbi:hypothetical protein GIB67_024350 [Kingdonia uniflora]|uniref:Programmed cell death protein 2 C-terminal domain-containing protein n=1 Tax=Kingdonia uniflora TaxID=39325 RepID=A0A7J7LF21_9MAGN|nr:hypothetical protein GIB67_024350 [Kingdonia uniflora]